VVAANRERAITAEVVREGCLASVNEETGQVGTVLVPPTPYVQRRKATDAVQEIFPPTFRMRVEPDAAAEGQVAAAPDDARGAPRQQTSGEELAALKIKAAKLQAVIDAPSSVATERARAQSALDPILSRIRALETALRGPQPTGMTAQVAEIDRELAKPEHVGVVAALNEATGTVWAVLVPEPYFTTRKERTT
jgi:hypothetical protein